MSSAYVKTKKTVKTVKPEEEKSCSDGELTIGALAKACGLTVRALRYYEEMDLIRPVKRSAGKYRLYNQRSLKRVNAISALQALGYSLEEILKMLGPCSEGLMYSKVMRIEATQSVLKAQKHLVDGKLLSLQQFKNDIEQRMRHLTQFCEPCREEDPEGHCSDACDYRDLHLS